MKLVISLLFGISATLAWAAAPATPAPKKKPLPPLGSALDRPGAKSTPKPQPKSALKPAATPPAKPLAKPPATPPLVGNNIPAATAGRSLSFEARQIGSGSTPEDTATHRNENGNLVKTRARKSQTTLEIQIRNLSREPDSAHLDWFFVARSVQAEKVYVWDKGERDVTVPPASQKKETVDSEELVSAVSLTISSSSDGRGHASEKKSGARPYGWIVRMSVGDQLVKVQASNSELDKIARNPAQFAELLKAQPPLDPGATDSK